MNARWMCVALVSGLVCAQCERRDPVQIVIEPNPSVETLVDTVLNGGGNFREVSFSTLIEHATGNRVLSLNPEEPIDAEILEALTYAFDQVMDQLNGPDSPTHQESRINEVSVYFEEALLAEIDRAPELECSLPRTAQGKLQRAGYPDLVIRHIESGRVVYLDPKLVKRGSMNSSLRTFYFTPRRETNKVLYDAHHLLVGIEHDGNTGAWQYLRWHLVDLTHFKVSLKAEFQADNRDIYRPEHLIKTSQESEGFPLSEQ